MDLFNRLRFELPALAQVSGRVWLGLLVLMAAPFPLWFIGPHSPVGFPVIERGVPIFFILLAAGLLILGRVAVYSWPFAALILWAAARGAWHSFPPRTLQLLTLVLFAGLLYTAARALPDRDARWAAWAAVAGLSWEGMLGLFNTLHWYPWMQWVSPEHFGKPMGLLTHPNYWGSLMALGLPVICALYGLPAACLVFALICRTVSGGPVITASVGMLVLAWPLFGPKVRLAVAGVGAASIATIMSIHEWRLSGRSEVWGVSLGELRRWLFSGQGLGEWRSWADQWNYAHYNPDAGRTFFITLQAHNEPLQLLFELGLLGLLIAVCLGLQAGQAAYRVWHAAPVAVLPMPEEARPGDHPIVKGIAACRYLLWGRVPLERAWVAVLAAAAVNMLGSPTLHLPAQAMLVLFAFSRVQADAAAFQAEPPRTTNGNHHRVKPARKSREHHVASASA